MDGIDSYSNRLMASEDWLERRRRERDQRKGSLLYGVNSAPTVRLRTSRGSLHLRDDEGKVVQLVLGIPTLNQITTRTWLPKEDYMSRYYQRPENALKKANEFIEVGKPTRALDTLYDVIKGKKHRAFSEKVIEPIMLKYLELCVELKKPHTAKEGLYQYRLMCQSVNVGLLEKVIRSFIRMAEEKTETARDALKKEVVEQSEDVIVEVDDLDNLSMAEMTLLNVITEEQAQERSDRAALIPWVKFLWESYTQCLDLLRNNARLENLYHDIAQMAFKFCLSFNRKTEFRKLCERLRKHFDDIVNRQGSQMNSIDFSAPETQQLNMETRLAQLDSAITLELWQEAYKAIEDIHLLMNQSKKLQTRMMAYYYQKLSLVFWKAGNLLFHAATLLKYYMLCKDMKKNVSAEELQKNASQVSLATLAIPFPVVHPEFERFVETDKGMLEKSQKLAMLLFLPQPPTRASLIRDLLRYGVLNNSIPPLLELYEVLETQFNPLELCELVDQSLKTLQTFSEHEYIEQYIEAVQDVSLVRLIKQISQVYQNIDYDHLLKMTVFADQTRVEQLLVDAVRYNDMQINIDHRIKCIKFGSSLAEASREDLPEGPHLQAMPSEAVRLQLVNVLNSVDETMEMFAPTHFKSEDDIIRTKIVSHYLLKEKQSHIALLQRQKIIAERREELERSAADKENEEKWRSEQMVIQQKAIEAKRLETEREERERKRIETERQKIHHNRLMERIVQIKNSPLGIKVTHILEQDDLSKMDVEAVLLKQQEEMAKEAKEQLTRLKAHEKRLDHLERAKRQEEIPIIKKYVEEKKELEKKEWEAHEAERIAHLIEERKITVATRDRMKRMREDKNTFLNGLLDSRREVFLEKVKNFNDDLARTKAERLQERKEKRKEERQQKYRQAVEEEQRRQEEEIRRIEEEKMREEREKSQKELEERNRITMEKQMAKQREIEERDERERRERNTTVAPSGEKPAAEPWRPPSKVAAASGAGDRPAGGAWIPSVRRRAQESQVSDVSPAPESFRRQQPEEKVFRDRREPEEKVFRDRREPEYEREREKPRERDEWRTSDRDRNDKQDRDGRGGYDNSRGAPRGGPGPRTQDRDRQERVTEDSWRRGGAPNKGGSDRDSGNPGRPSGGSSATGQAGFRRNERERGDRDGGFNAPADEGSWRRGGKKEEPAARTK